MTREQLKKLANEIKAFSYEEGSAKGYMQFIISAQDAYINKLSEFIEEITRAGGKYSHLNGDIIIADAYKILGK